MKRVIVSEKTMDEALNSGLERLGTIKEKVDYEVLQESEEGFLGILGGQKARIKINNPETKIEHAKLFLKKILDTMASEFDVKVIEKNEKKKKIILNITGEDLGLVIGYRGKTLDALQYLTNLAVNKGEEDYLQVALDAEGYRNRRKKTLEKLAIKMSKKAKNKGTKLKLDPMPAHERKIIHTTLQSKSNVSTHSEGQEPYRKVVIVAE
ncbi:MAG: RNA-binding cell elongation regulator Jag/EloR [Bacillota bacterium]